jgi:FKBP-type peptidyl-prolyl cis-trans isomerase
MAATAADGAAVLCGRRYVGRLKSNGKVFDKTDKKPFAFRLGE